MKYIYQHIKGPLSNTDLLAIGRNELANERTLLAYIRTFLSFLIAGVSLIQFFKNSTIIFLGYLLIPVGLLILFIGIIRFFKTQKLIKKALITTQKL